MKAMLFTEVGKPLKYTTDYQAEQTHERVQVAACGLNRRDYWITVGKYPNIVTPTILGSDVCGIHNGEEVILSPNIDWGPNPRLQSKAYSILGLETKGGLAEWCDVPKENIYKKPAHLTHIEAAALPLAGVTAYRALVSNCQVQAGEKVLITGIGGGVATLAMQFAKALGAEVYVTSSSQEKITIAQQHGATNGVLYTDADWSKQLKAMAGKFDVIIDSAGGDGFGDLVHLCNHGARIGIFGGTAGKWPAINPGHLFFKQVTIYTSTMGNNDEFAQMLKLVDDHKIKPIVGKTFPLASANEALEALRQKAVFGKIVVEV